MKVHIVYNDEYWGTAELADIEMPDSPVSRVRTPQEVWRFLNEVVCQADPGTYNEDISTEDQPTYLENWDAYGSHHSGMITRMWWGEDAEEKAKECYQGLLDKGIPAVEH
jgi:hypothetical protein